MTVTPSFRAWIEDLLGQVEPVRTRAMFGGVGIYARGHFFGLAADDVLYFKVDDETRARYESRGMGPFRPYGSDGRAMKGYYQVPADVLEDPPLLARWMDDALEVAEAAKRTPRRRGSAPRRGR